MTTDSNQSGASSAGADGQSNTKSTSSPSCESPAGTEGQLSTKSTGTRDSKYRWIFWTLMIIIIAPIVAAAAVVLLVGLPLGAVWIMNNSNCCLADGPENMLTFWASMIAGFLALFGMVVTAVFIITAFRIDATARDKAQVAAQEEVWKYIEHYEEKLVKDLMDLKTFAKKMLAKVTKIGCNATRDIKAQREKARREIAATRDAAIKAIVAAANKTTSVANQAQEGIAQALKDVETQQEEASSTIVAARDATTKSASQAQEKIAEALEETTKAATEAQEAIDRARQEAEAAAREMRERADRGPEGPTPTGGDDPDQT